MTYQPQYDRFIYTNSIDPKDDDIVYVYFPSAGVLTTCKYSDVENLPAPQRVKAAEARETREKLFKLIEEGYTVTWSKSERDEYMANPDAFDTY